MSISFVMPVFNEEESLIEIVSELLDMAKELNTPYEIILVNDGSVDNSWHHIKTLCGENNAIKGIDLRRNFGQTTAMQAGFDYSKHDCIIVLDSDGQNDPRDVPALYKKYLEGFDVVSGWRKDRKDNAIIRNFPSKVANRLISGITNVALHDYGCSLKAYDAQILKSLRLYGEMHRFVPIFMYERGARVTEMVVNHRERYGGVSKYGLERVVKVLFDLFLTTYFLKHKSKPGHIFGWLSLWTMFASILSAGYACFLKLAENVSFVSTPLLLFSGVMFVSSLFCIALAIQLDFLMRIYFEGSNRSSYSVREKI